MKTITCTLFLLSVLIGSVLYAQDSTIVVVKNRHAYVDISAGWLNANLLSVNRSIAQSGYKPIKENFATLSLSSGFFFNRFLIRDELTILFKNTVNQPGNLTSSFGGYSLGIGFGYTIIQQPRFRLTPYVGLNSFVAQLKLEDNATVNNMGEVINTPHRTAQMYFSNASLDLGVQLEKLFQIKNKKWDCPQNTKFMTVNARFGYYIGPNDVRGKYNGNQAIAGAPAFSMSGPYIKLGIGFSTKMRELKWKK